MPAMAQAAAEAIPAGFERVGPTDVPKPVVRVKTEPEKTSAAEPAPVAVSSAADPASTTQEGGGAEGPSSTPAPAESGTQVAEPSKLERAKQAAQSAKAAAKRNRDLKAQHANLERSLQVQNAEAQQLQARAAEAERLLKGIQSDPLGAIKALGITPAELARRMAADGSPEAMIAETRALIERQQKQIEALHAEKAQAAERTRVEQIELEYKQKSQDTKKYPSLSQVHPDFVLAATHKLITDLRARGVDPRSYSDHDYLEYLDTHYAKPSAPKAAETPAAPAPESTAGKKTGTVTTKLASSRQALPPNFSKLSDREQRKAMADQLRQAGLAK